MPSPSIENKLSAALAPVEAPAELWTRVNSALPAAAGRRASSQVWPRLLMAATLAALMSGGVLYLRAQQAATYTPSNFAAAAVRMHASNRPPDNGYAVQRYLWEGQPVTVVSAAEAPGERLPTGPKFAREADFDRLTVSEWTSEGRRWAMVSAKSAHKRACSVCHRA